MLKSLWWSVQNDPVFMRRVNGWAALLWLLAALPICVFLSTSVPFLVFVSVYAVVTGHWSTWQAARVEVNQENEARAKSEENIPHDVVKAIVEHTTVDHAPDQTKG